MDPALDSVSIDLIRRFFRKACDYERVYIEGKAAGKEVEQAMKVFKSHRRNDLCSDFFNFFYLFCHNLSTKHSKNNLLYKSVALFVLVIWYNFHALP